MTQFLRPAILIPALAGFLLGVVIEVLADMVAEGGRNMLLGLFIVTALALLLALTYRAGRRTTARFGAPVVIRTLVDNYTEGRHGLIAVVSLYNPHRDSPAATLNREERLAAAQQLDYETLHLEQSNYAPLITAVAAHAPRLQHCWLISTLSEDPATSSLTYVPVVERYLREVKGIKCQFHSGEEYALVIEKDDALVAERARSLVNRIFAQATRPPIALQEQDIVADITSGIRTIPLGITMACLDKQRMVQFVGTRYDDQAQPSGDLVPILFDYIVEVIDE